MTNILDICHEILAAGEKATPATWYSHPWEGQVRGPYNRWFQVVGPPDRHPNGYHASASEDVDYFTVAANHAPELAREVLRLTETELVTYGLATEHLTEAQTEIDTLKAQLSEALNVLWKIAEKDTLNGEKYRSFEAGWNGVADFARAFLTKQLEGGK